MCPGKRSRSQLSSDELIGKMEEALKENDPEKRSRKIAEVKELLIAHENEIDWATEMIESLDLMKDNVKVLEPLLRLGPHIDQRLTSAEYLASYKQFDNEYAKFKSNVENALKPLLEEIVMGMIDDLYEFGTFGSAEFHEEVERQIKLKEVFGPKGDIHLRQFPELKLGRKLEESNKDRSPIHLRNVLFLSLIPYPDGSRITQKEIGDLTGFGQSKISLDIFMAKQILLESWLEDRIKGIPNLEITVGATGGEPSEAGTLLWDSVYRWPRHGFGYLVLEHTITKKAAIIMLHIFEGRGGTITGLMNYSEEEKSTSSKGRRNLRDDIRSYVNLLQTSPHTNLAEGYPDSFSNLPIGHFISSGRYYETAFVHDKNFSQYFETPGIGGNKADDFIEDLFV